MSSPRANPTRLSFLPEGEAPHEVRRMFREARELPDEDLPKLMWRIRASQRRRATLPRRVLRLVLVVGGVFCMGGFVGAYWGRRQSTIVAPPPAPAASPKSPRWPSPLPTSATPPAPAETVPDQTKVERVPRPRPRARVAMVSRPTPIAEPAPPTAPPSPIAAEQALVGRAMQALRDDHEPQTALALLGEHARQFPTGAFRSEANLLRIEALLALGRKDEALAMLDRAPIMAAPNRDEQLVLRGELRSTNGRWVEAKEDFDHVLRRHGEALAAPAKAREVQERALWGRAAARSRLGDEAGARADLELYLDLFPEGRFARRASKLLDAAP